MKFHIHTLLILSLLSFTAAAQNSNFVASLKSDLDSFSSQYPQEQIYLHTDRATYVSSEPIWFKMYCMTDGLPSYVSKVVYADLINEKGTVIQKRMYSLKNGTASGNIDIPSNLPTGKYLIRSYTLWMLNFPGFIYKKEINIFNKEKTEAPSNTGAGQLSLRFFPEGGDLIAGINSKIAFKAVNSDGNPLHITAKVYSSDDRLIADMKSIHDGMGIFELNPVAGKSYYATVVVNGMLEKFPLPEVKPNGALLMVDPKATKIFIRVERSPNALSDLDKFTIIGQQMGRLVYSAEANFELNETATLINKKNLLPGILQLTLFNSKQQPISERLVFIHPNTTDEMLVFSKDSINLTARGKNQLELKNKTGNNPSVSISITDASITAKEDNDNIISSLLLTNDLHGKINDPAYYFKKNDSTSFFNTDLLMRVNGWRRFTWEQIQNRKEIPLSFIAEPGNNLSGKVVKGLNKNVEITDGRLDIMVKAVDSTVILNTIKLNSNGEFFIPDLDFKKSAKLYFQGTNLKKEKAYVRTLIQPAYIDTLKSVSLQSYPWLAKNPLLPAPPALLNNEISFKKDSNDLKMLQEVKVYSKKISKEDSVSNIYASGMFMNSDNSLIVDENTKFFSIWQLIRSSIAGIDISGDPISPTVRFTRYSNLGNVFASQTEDGGTSGGVETSNGIAYYLNEINVPKDIIDNLSINDVSLVKIFKGTSAFLLGTGEGAIAVYTKNSSYTSDPRLKSMEMIVKTGFDVKREFYSPDYSKDASSVVVDKRATLYWNPEVKFDKSGVAKLIFYNNDTSNKLLMRIEGFDMDGQLISIQQIIE